MEHIGKHFERAEREKNKLGKGEEDPELRTWALKQGIVVDCGDRGFWLDGLQGSQVIGKFTEGGVEEEDAVGDDE